jgi:hypothetical protein
MLEVMRPTDQRKTRLERGASFVEFALIMPLFLLLFAGIVDFGVRLSEQHALQDGIRDATRTAAVGELGGTNDCVIVGDAPPNLATKELVCLAKERIRLEESDTRISIVLSAAGAIEGQPLLVCAQYPGGSITGLLPEFGSRPIESRSIIRLETDSDVESYAEISHSGTWVSCEF